MSVERQHDLTIDWPPAKALTLLVRSVFWPSKVMDLMDIDGVNKQPIPLHVGYENCCKSFITLTTKYLIERTIYSD